MSHAGSARVNKRDGNITYMERVNVTLAVVKTESNPTHPPAEHGNVAKVGVRSYN